MNVRFSATLAVCLTLGLSTQAANNNSWKAGNGKWEDSGNWSLGIPPASIQMILITNAGNNTVTVDAVTTNSPTAMSVSNLVIGADALLITSTGTSVPLTVSLSLTISTNGSIVVTNAALGVNSGTVSVGGSLTVDAASFVATNGPLIVGSGSGALLKVNSGSVLLNSGTLAGSSGPRGTWQINGGTNVLSGQLSVGQTGSGTITATGGLLVVTNSFGNGLFNVGDTTTGKGIVIVSNAEVRAHALRLGNFGVGTLTLNTGTLSARSNMVLGVNVGSTGTVFVAAGTMVVTNATHDAAIDVRRGTFTLSNGTVIADVIVATNAGSFVNYGGTLIVTTRAQLDQGTQTVANGSAQILSNLVVASTADSTGTVNVTGGSLTVTNGVLGIGNDGDVTGVGGIGSLVVTSATVVAKSVLLGSALGGRGVMTLQAGGVLQFPTDADPSCADCGLSLNEAVLDGGEIDAASSPFFAGKTRPGELIVSNGVATFRSGYVGYDNPGQLEMDGGTVTVLSNLLVGDCGASVTGLVTVTAGNLYVTNATHDAVLDVRDGSFVLNGGRVQVDVLVMTNWCGLFVRNGGILMYGTLVLDPDLDADGDGIPNGYEQAYGLDPLNMGDASADADGDGMSNLQEYLAGTDPTNGASVLAITSITQEGDDIRVTWNAVSNTPYIVQTSSSPADGTYTNLSPLIFGRPGLSSTNYLDSGGATNPPPRFYRVLLYQGPL